MKTMLGIIITLASANIHAGENCKRSMDYTAESGFALGFYTTRESKPEHRGNAELLKQIQTYQLELPKQINEGVPQCLSERGGTDPVICQAGFDQMATASYEYGRLMELTTRVPDSVMQKYIEALKNLYISCGPQTNVFTTPEERLKELDQKLSDLEAARSRGQIAKHNYCRAKINLLNAKIKVHESTNNRNAIDSDKFLLDGTISFCQDPNQNL